MRDLISSQKAEFYSIKQLQGKLKYDQAWEAIDDPSSAIYQFLMLPEMSLKGKPGQVCKLSLSCVAMLWSRDDFQMTHKDNIFKELTRDNSIKYILEKMIRISTILTYGRMRDFNISNT